jgi:nickel transport system ATP-binding protein
MNKYPHQLSGGMLQRMMIALAFVLEPDIIIADEPTTALDTISQFEVVEQFITLRERMGCSMIFISHDLGVVRKIADDVLVMKDGKIIERGDTQTIFLNAKHEYTKYLVTTRLALSHNFNKIMGRV